MTVAPPSDMAKLADDLEPCPLCRGPAEFDGLRWNTRTPPASESPLSATVSREAGWGVFWEEKGQTCSVLKSTENEALTFAARTAPAGASVEKVYRALSTPAQPETWECMGRKQSLPEPGECNWPYCGCDPHATKVIASLCEQGWRSPYETAQPETVGREDCKSAIKIRLKEMRADRSVHESYRLGRIEGLQIALEAIAALSPVRADRAGLIDRLEFGSDDHETSMALRLEAAAALALCSPLSADREGLKQFIIDRLREDYEPDEAIADAIIAYLASGKDAGR